MYNTDKDWILIIAVMIFVIIGYAMCMGA